jgi:hypothetical protein
MKVLLAALAVLALPPSVHPWPIGKGPRYLPPASSAAVAAGRPVGSLACGSASASFRLHLEVFVNRKVVVVPSGIGVSRPGCVYPVRTTAPGGVVEVARGVKLTLADLFRVWGQPLAANRLVSFASKQPVRVYVAGRRVHEPVGAVPLTRHAEIVVELGGYVAPHPFFLFPGGDS